MDIPHNRPTFDRREIRAASEVITSNWVAQGRKVAEFENQFCKYLGLPDGHAVAVSSGSAALYLALLALGARGKKVGMPIFACAAVSNAIVMADGSLLFIDSEKLSPNIEVKTTNNEQIHTLIGVSTFGIPLPIPPKREFYVIEDFSQAIGATVHNNKVGTLGDIGITSLSATKLITSGGQGGIIVSQNLNIIEQVRDYREFDARTDSKSRFNFQMTDIQAGIGLVQLEKLPSFLAKREEIFQVYSDAKLELLREVGEAQSAVRYRAVVQMGNPLQVQEKLSSVGVRSIVPITFDELVLKSDEMENANRFTRNTLSIPIFPSLKISDAKKIAKYVSAWMSES